MAGVMDWLTNLLGDRQLKPVVTDVRTPEQHGMQVGLQGEYARAQADPNYGMGTPEQQRLQEQVLSDSVRDRTAASAGGSGFQGDQIRKAITDFRIGLIGKRQQYLDTLRSAMVAGTGVGNQVSKADEQTGIARSGMNTMVGTMASRAGNALGNAAFGEDPAAAQAAGQQNANQPGGAPGTTGSRPNGGMRVT